jgi:hypothetical protein
MIPAKRARYRRRRAFIKQRSQELQMYTGVSRDQGRFFARVEWDRALSLERKAERQSQRS